MPSSFSLSAADSLLFLWDFLPVFFCYGWLSDLKISITVGGVLPLIFENSGSSGEWLGEYFTVESPLMIMVSFSLPFLDLLPCIFLSLFTIFFLYFLEILRINFYWEPKISIMTWFPFVWRAWRSFSQIWRFSSLSLCRIGVVFPISFFPLWMLPLILLWVLILSFLGVRVGFSEMSIFMTCFTFEWGLLVIYFLNVRPVI